jgi:hypothetical protein
MCKCCPAQLPIPLFLSFFVSSSPLFFVITLLAPSSFFFITLPTCLISPSHNALFTIYVTIIILVHVIMECGVDHMGRACEPSIERERERERKTWLSL